MSGESSAQKVVCTGIYERVEPKMVSVREINFETFCKTFLQNYRETEEYNWSFQRISDAAKELEAFQARLAEHNRDAFNVAMRGEPPPKQPRGWPTEATSWDVVFGDIKTALKWYRALQRVMNSGDFEQIAVAAYWFGRLVEKIKVRMREDNARIGKTKRENARLAGKSRTKSVEEQEARKTQISEAYERLSKANPNLTEKAKVRRLSIELGICQRIIWAEKPSIKRTESTA
jgi:hypothetical protein